MSTRLQLLRHQIASKLLGIEDLLSSDWKLTLLARHTKLDDADIVVTADDLDKAIGALTALKDKETV